MDLKEYRSRIKNLSINEQKLRDIHLAKLAKGEIQGPPTGYASLDKSWLRYYSANAIDALADYEDNDCSMYETLIKYAANNKEKIAFEYLGRKFSYGELTESIDKTANALVKSGVKENEIIPILLPNVPEARFLIYACSKIGAIPNPIMPTISEIDFETIINNTKANHIFLMAGLKEKFIKSLNDKISIEVSPLYSANGLLNALYKVQTKFKKQEYDTFLETGIGEKAQLVHGKSSDIALIEQTGGTTALTTKGVVITNGNVNASNYQLENGDFNFDEGDSLLDILLPSISYGSAFEHLTLSNGIKNYMIPILVKEDINKFISKYKPNHVMMGPIHFEFVSKDKKKRNWDHLKNIVSGGDSMTLSLECKSNERLREISSPVSVEQGYGESECFGAAACNHNEFIKNGSVGIPHLLTTISIFQYNEDEDDYTSDIEMQENNFGEICISSPVVMKEYLNNKEATDAVLKEHSDGKIWLHTGDIGYVDENGYLFITDRIKDLIFRNGFKVSPQKINQCVQEKLGKYFETSCVIGVPDDTERNVPVLFYKLKDDSELDEEEINKQLGQIYEEKLSEIERPKESISLNIIPRTGAGKIDKKTIKKNYLEGLGKVLVKK